MVPPNRRSKIANRNFRLRQSRLEELDLLLELFKLPIQHALVLCGVSMFDAPADFAAFQFQPLDLGDPFRFGVVNRTHRSLHSLTSPYSIPPGVADNGKIA